MPLILLGPSAWLPRYRPTIPGWVAEILPPGRATEGKPVPTARDVRFGLIARLRQADVKATALELHHDRSRESLADKLLRVLHEGGVDRYAIYWPYGAIRPAVDVEIGWLLHSLQQKEISGEHIGIFYEWNPEGRKTAPCVFGLAKPSLSEPLSADVGVPRSNVEPTHKLIDRLGDHWSFPETFQ
jgi:hypothetical protein